jgi:ABC-type multidrug transport system fused ATPase/permease subunit
MSVGYKRTVDPMDLYYLEEDMSIDTTFDIFQKRLKVILAKHRAKLLKKNPNVSDEELDEYPRFAVIFALFLTFNWQFSSAVLFKCAADVGAVLAPLLSKELINFVQYRTVDPSLSVGKGVGYAFGVVAIMVLNGICINHFLHRSLTTGAQCKSILTTALLRKSLIADAKTKHDFSPGKVTSLMSTDLARIDLAVGLLPFGLTFPVPVIIAIALLIHNIGVSALAGIAVFILAVLLTSSSMKRLMMMRRGATVFTDQRISLMREILLNMKIIKFYSWEDAYEKEIVDRRSKETRIIFKIQTIKNFLIAMSVSLPALISMIAFLVLFAVRNDKNPGAIFASLSLFSVLANQVLMLPLALATSADAMVGLNRVRQYLQSGDHGVQYGDDITDDSDSSFTETDSDVDVKDQLADDVAIELKNATFEWDIFPDNEESDDSTPEINEEVEEVKSTTDDDKNNKEEKVAFKGFHDISFQIKKNEFVIITGPIGSGKSSLLTALSGFMTKSAGQLRYQSKPLLCSQPPWVQNATVRQNITFGEEYDPKWYDAVIAACSLEDDLENFPAGDRTEIGERGITLSGGQKARISLARAVYSKQSILLFDDVLSAVDSRVGRHIVDSCFLDLLKNQTRVLATHQLSLIESADRVLFLNGDGTINIGTVNELLAQSEAFVQLMAFSKHSEEEEKTEEEVLDELAEEGESLALQLTAKDGKGEISGVLFNEEERAKNQITWSVYRNYMKEGQGIFGIFAIPLAALLLIADVFCSIFTNVWLSFWISNKWADKSDGYYIGLYVMFTILAILFVIIEFVIIGYITITSAKKLNLKATKKILHTPMSFIDTTPMGRILNRFSKDTDALDNETGDQIRLFLHPTAYVIGVLILCICYFPWFAIAVPPLVIVFIAFTNYYQATSREVKRIEAVKRSLVYNNFNEILTGMLTIKAYSSKERFLVKNSELINKMNEAYFIVIANQRWISVHLDLVAATLALIVSLLSVNRVFNINAASAGLVVTNVMQIAGLMSLILRAYTQVENEMNSVERLTYYGNELEQESAYKLPENKPAESWPERGQIEFKNASLRYRENLPLVLKNLSLSVKPNEKIGICGRTGAGKSTIMMALYRMSELSEGQILIDGVDVSQIGLFDLRSKLSIIPQDPVLFIGTIRKNLDPFGESTDTQLWDALRRAGLIENIKNITNSEGDLHKFHLDQQVEDEGSNFSLGERQLLALARALVRNSKILILDEATSSVDYETDSKIQNTIINEFSHCTILCIAHRLKTILTYDRVLVLDQGEAVEFDTPTNLFNVQGSIFRQMCEKSNISAADFQTPLA